MKLSFMPGKMFLDSEDGIFRIKIDGKEVFRGRSQRSAVAKFNSLRAEMEKQFPAAEMSEADRAAAFQRMLGDYLVQHNSLGGRKKKTTAGSTRTFGG